MPLDGHPSPGTPDPPKAAKMGRATALVPIHEVSLMVQGSTPPPWQAVLVYYPLQQSNRAECVPRVLKSGRKNSQLHRTDCGQSDSRIFAPKSATADANCRAKRRQCAGDFSCRSRVDILVSDHSGIRGRASATLFGTLPRGTHLALEANRGTASRYCQRVPAH